MSTRTTFAESADDILFVIWSNEHEAFWGHNFCGYTKDHEKAGRYNFTDAAEICAKEFKHLPAGQRPYETMIPLLNEQRQRREEPKS